MTGANPSALAHSENKSDPQTRIEAPVSVFPCVGGSGAIYIDAPEHTAWIVTIPEHDRQWLNLNANQSNHSKGPAIIKYELKKNPRERRESSLEIRQNGKLSHIQKIVQASGQSLVTQTNSVMDLPFLEFPRIMELGIAGKFIASELQKIPEPFDLIALLVVEIAIAICGILIAILRTSVPPHLLPTPVSAFSFPPLPPPCPLPIPSFIDPDKATEFLQKLPLTPAFILEQTATLDAYIATQMLGGE